MAWAGVLVVASVMVRWLWPRGRASVGALIAALAGIALVVAGTGEARAQEGGVLSISNPGPFKCDDQYPVTLTLDLNGDPLLGSVEDVITSPQLIVVSEQGVQTVIGKLWDDGLHGDGDAGDHVFGAHHVITGQISSTQYFTSTAYRGVAQRRESNTILAPACPQQGGRLTVSDLGPFICGQEYEVFVVLDLNVDPLVSRVRNDANSPNLISENGQGVRTVVGKLWDDGLHGDGAAGDNVFGALVNFHLDPGTPRMNFFAATAYRGRAARMFSNGVLVENSDPCCGNSDPCCGFTGENLEICRCQGSNGTWNPETKQCCSLDNPCCLSSDPCCGSSGEDLEICRCQGSNGTWNPETKECCSPDNPCCLSSDPCCGLSGEDLEICRCQGSNGTWHPETKQCCALDDPCCGSTDPSCSGYPLLVGAGMHDVTGPAAGGGMSGYQHDDLQKAQGLHDRQWARAFIIGGQNSGDKRVVFVVVETAHLYQSITQGVYDKLMADDELKRFYSDQNLVLSATHTHSPAAGCSYYPSYNLNVGGFQWQAYDAMVHGIFTAIKKAHSNLAPGRILVNRSKLENANENRAADRFQQNIELHHAHLTNPFGNDNRDTEMLCLRIEHSDGKEIGMLNWFPVHGTSFSVGNQLLSGDNKGYAAHRFELVKGSAYPGHPRSGSTTRFVAGFANSNAGDLSPNRFDSEKPWPENGVNDELRVQTIGSRQFAKALELYDGAIGAQSHETRLPFYLKGQVDYRHMYVAMTNVAVVPGSIYPYSVPGVGFGAGGTPRPETYIGALGVDFSMGRHEGEGISHQLTDTARLFGWIFSSDPVERELIRWHSPKKPLMLPTGMPFVLKYSRADTKDSIITWMPQVLPISILRVGNLAILAVPAELTSMAGRRLRVTVQEAFGREMQTIIAGYANDYSSYVTTFEEYSYLTPSGYLAFDAQSYEAASTQFGPYTLAAYQTKFAEMAHAMAAGIEVSSAPMPRTFPPKPSWETFPFQWRTTDAGEDGLPLLESERRAAEFKGVALNKCPDGQFFDPRDGGTCWSCPAGYIKAESLGDQPIFCNHLPPIQFETATFRDGICDHGQFFFGGACWSCKEGEDFSRFGDSNLCHRPKKDEFARADDLGPVSICPGENYDPVLGLCWHCPEGYTKVADLLSVAACARARYDYQTALSTPAPLGGCPTILFAQYAGRCYLCPSGSSKNPDALWDSISACRKPVFDTARAVVAPVRPCPQGGEPADDGRCRRCPSGYSRSSALIPLSSPAACSRTIAEAFVLADGYGTPSRCEDRNATWFTDPFTFACWSCPDGFAHVPGGSPLLSSACVRIFQPYQAEFRGHLSCEGRGRDVGEEWFLDLGRGECWSCGGWLRNLYPVNGPEGCTAPHFSFGSVVNNRVWQLPDLRRYRQGQTVSIEFWGGHPKNAFGSEEFPTLDAVPTFFEIQKLSNGGWETVKTDADWDTTLEWRPFGIPPVFASKLKVNWAIGGDASPGTYRIIHHGQYKDFLTSEFRTYSGESPRFEVMP